MSSFEQELRDKLQQSGLLDRMKSLFLDAAMNVVKNDADPSRIDPRLLKPSPLLIQNRETEEFSMSLALVIDFLRQYNLLHTLNCLKSECGPDVFPQDMEETEEEIQEERIALCEDLEISTEGSALERIYQKAVHGVGASSSNSNNNNNNNNNNTPMKTHTIAEMPKQQHQQQQQQSPEKQQQQSSPSSSSSSPAGSQHNSPVKSNKANAPADATAYPTDLVPHANGKAKETLYTVEWFDGGEFVRYNQIAGQPFVMEYMRNCRVIILDSVDSVTMDDCENCEVVVTSCQQSFFIRTCKNVKLIVACKQLRTRDCVDCDVHLFTSTDPVVENSCGMNFFPFNLEAPKLIESFQAAKFDAKLNRFVHVYDFTPDNKLAKEHFTIHWPDHKNTTMQRYGMGVDEDAINSPPEIRMLINGEIEPAQSLERGAGKSLNIKTGAQQWQQQATQQPQNQNNNNNQQQQQQRPTTAPANTTAPSTTSTENEARPQTASNLRVGGISGVPPISGIAGTQNGGRSVGNTSNNNHSKHSDSPTSSDSDAGGVTPTRTRNENAKNVVAAAPAPAPAPHPKPTESGDAYMLKRDSSSSSESSYSSFEGENEDEF